MTLLQKQNLYRDSCTVVAHFGREIERLFTDLRTLSHELDDGSLEALMPTPIRFAQVIGDLLEGADMCMDDDEWVNPIFERMNSYLDEPAP
jgi:hypothetical protein